MATCWLMIPRIVINLCSCVISCNVTHDHAVSTPPRPPRTWSHPKDSNVTDTFEARKQKEGGRTCRNASSSSNE